jgi:hypothetical protein
VELILVEPLTGLHSKGRPTKLKQGCKIITVTNACYQCKKFYSTRIKALGAAAKIKISFKNELRRPLFLPSAVIHTKSS